METHTVVSYAAVQEDDGAIAHISPYHPTFMSLTTPLTDPKHRRSVRFSEYLTKPTVRAFAIIALSLWFDSLNPLFELEPSIGLTLR